MKRQLVCLLLLAAAQPAWAKDRNPPYYGPMKRWHGIGYKFGYEDRIEKDGSWRIETAIRGYGEPVDMALYRAAERAHEEGYRYIFFLGGKEVRSPGLHWATVYARPSHEPTAPVACRSELVTTCYTADVGEVLRILGGPGGTQPGVAVADHRDIFGREVFLSGYGTGGIATSVPGQSARSYMTTVVDNRTASRHAAAAPIVHAPRPTAMAPTSAALQRATVQRGAAILLADERFQQALKANEPVRGRDPVSGATISD